MDSKILTRLYLFLFLSSSSRCGTVTVFMPVECSSNLLKFYSLPSIHLILGIVQIHFEE